MKRSWMQGVLALAAGYRLLISRPLRAYAIIPALLSISLLISGFFWLSHWLNQQLQSWSGWFGWLPDWLTSWLNGLLWLSGFALFLVLANFLFLSLSSLIASPFNSLLSDKTRRVLGEPLSDDPFRWSQLGRLLLHSLQRELAKLFYMLPHISLLLLLSLLSFWLPLLNLLTSGLWLLLGSWLLAVQYLDYPADSQGLSLSQTLEVLRRKRLTVLSFGFACYLLVWVPGLNLLLVPAAICGATRLWLQLEKLPAKTNSQPLRTTP